MSKFWDPEFFSWTRLWTPAAKAEQWSQLICTEAKVEVAKVHAGWLIEIPRVVQENSSTQCEPPSSVSRRCKFGKSRGGTRKVVSLTQLEETRWENLQKTFLSVVRSKNVWMLDLIGCGFVAIKFPIDLIREAISKAYSSPNDVTVVQCSYEFNFVGRWMKLSWRCVDTLLRLKFRRVKDSRKCSPLHAWPELDRYWLTEPRTFIYVR